MMGKWVLNISVLGKNLGVITDYSCKPSTQWAPGIPEGEVGEMNKDKMSELKGKIFSLSTNPVLTYSLKKKNQSITAGKDQQETIQMIRRRLLV